MPRRSQMDLQPDSPGVNLDAIARQLGVAVSTVSRALRNHPGIHPSTRLRIQTEAARLGYAVKRRAEERAEMGAPKAVRHLLTLAQSLNNTSQQGYLAGISRAAQTHDIGVFSHHCSAADAATLMEPSHQPAALRVADLSGIILIHRWPHEVVASIAVNHPVVSIIHRYPGLPVDTVCMDDEANLGILVDHFRARGHERIGFFGYERSLSWSRSRFGAYVGAMAEAGLTYDPANVVGVNAEEAQAFLPPDLSALLPPLRTRIRAGVRAWICSSYVLAQGLKLTLATGGFDVPGEVELTGYHGGARVGLKGIIHLTTVETEDEALGAAAVHLLSHRALRSVPAPAVLQLPGQLVQGESTRAPV